MKDFVISYGDIIFDRLKFFRYSKYSEEFFNKLIDEGSHYSKIKYIDAVKEELIEEVHIKISFSIIFNILFYLTLYISTFFLYQRMGLPGIISTGFGIIFYSLYILFKTRACENYAGLNTSEAFVNMIFDN